MYNKINNMETIDFNTVIAENISVVEGLIGIATGEKDGLLSKNGFFYRGSIEENTDLDTVSSVGYYGIDNKKVINCPSDFLEISIYGTLIVIEGYYRLPIQVFISNDKMNLYFRTSISSGFKNWKNII